MRIKYYTDRGNEKQTTAEETEVLTKKPIVKVSINSGVEVDNINKLRERKM